MIVGKDKEKAIRQAIANAKSSGSPWRIFLNFKAWHVEKLDNVLDVDMVALPNGKILEGKELTETEIFSVLKSGVQCFTFFTRQRMTNVALQAAVSKALSQLDGYMFSQFGGANTDRLITVVVDTSKMMTVTSPAAIYKTEIEHILRKAVKEQS